jgi:CheY-like chemotaxis protein
MARMVIADDDTDLLAAFARTLARAGHDVTACPDAGAALTQIRSLGPDLVLTDIEMPPGMSGLEMVAAIRADPEIAGGPVTPPGVAALGIGPGVVAETDAEEPHEHAERSDDYGQK